MPAARNQPPLPERQSGFALIVVLWIVTLLALQVSLFNLTVRDAGALAGSELAIARGEALAAGGIELAVAHLMEPDAGARWPADGRTREVRLGGAILALRITDEAGRLDLNALPGDLADALLRPYGGSAETLIQRTDTQAGPFLDPTELAGTLGLRPSALQPLLAHLTVHGGDGKIDPMAASRETLLMLPGADPAEIDAALALRQRGASAADVARALPGVDKWLTERTGPAYRIEVAVHGESAPAFGWAEAVILIGKDAAAPFRVLAWRYEPRERPMHDDRSER